MMTSRIDCKLVLLLSVFGFVGLGAAQPAAAQFESENVELLAWMDLAFFGAGSGNDCWGYVSPSGREYALVGLSNKVAFVEITDPKNPDWFDSESHGSTTWCDIKVYRNHAYIVTEGSSGIQVMSMANIDSHSVSLVRTINSPSSSHNIAIDEVSGYLYTTGSNGGSDVTVIFDLSNPGSPVQVGTWGTYEHDMQVVTFDSGPNAGKQIMFGASEGRGIDIVDVTNKGNTFLLSRTAYPNVAYCHQVWTEDGKYLYVNDELDDINRTTVFDVENLANPTIVGEYSSGLTAYDHNNYVRDGFVYEADYHSGLRIFDANDDPTNPTPVGWFDTYPANDSGGFDGAWSVYPYFPSGTVIVSDITRGLFVLNVQNALSSLIFAYPDGQPDFIDPAGGTRMRVVVTSRGNISPTPGTAILHVNVGEQVWQEFPMEEIEDNVYDAVFPATECGSDVSYYVSAVASDDGTYTDPPDAPSSSFSVVSAAELAVFFGDDFQNDLGWTVENIEMETGEWERGVPIDSRGPPADFDGSGSCYVTGNSEEVDVDGGPVRVISPVLDLSGAFDPKLTYARWFTHNDPDEDKMDVEISDDNGDTWTTIETIVADARGWVQINVRIADYVNLTSQVMVRFSATDNPNNSVTEGGLDAFQIFDLVCDSTPGIEIVHGNVDWDRNDDNTWVSFNDHAFSGYIDPKVESTDGTNVELGLNSFNVVFNTEPFGDAVGGPVTVANISVEQTGGAAPNVSSVAQNGDVLTVELDRNITLQEWTTLVFGVWNADGVQIDDAGNEGEGVDEVARLDVGFLPTDVNNDGEGQPLDLNRWINSWNGGSPIFPPDVEKGHPDDYLDISRGGGTSPLDLARIIAGLKGQSPFTQNWRGVGMNNPQP